jgi:hypothetical protein
VLKDARQELDRDQQGEGRPSGDDPADVPASAVAMLAARLVAVPMVRAIQGSQPCEQDQGCDDLDSVDGERERVGVPAGVAVGCGEGAHVAVADRSGDPG